MNLAEQVRQVHELKKDYEIAHCKLKSQHGEYAGDDLESEFKYVVARAKNSQVYFVNINDDYCVEHLNGLARKNCAKIGEIGMIEKLTAKQEKHAKRWCKYNKIYQRMKTLHENVPSAILKEVESGLLEYTTIGAAIECRDVFNFVFTLNRNHHICYQAKKGQITFFIDSSSDYADKIWVELRNRITLEIKKRQ